MKLVSEFGGYDEMLLSPSISTINSLDEVPEPLPIAHERYSLLEGVPIVRVVLKQTRIDGSIHRYVKATRK